MPPKGLQPRIVLVSLLLGAGAGVWLSKWSNPIPACATWWLLVVALGSLGGGLYWRLVLFDATDFETGDVARSVTDRWRRVGSFTVAGVLVGGIGSVVTVAIVQPLNAGDVAIGVGIVLTPLLWIIVGRYSGSEPEAVPLALRWILFVVVLGSLGAIAWRDTGGRLFDWALRLGHLGAFALWVGGATWHNFVVLPTVRARPETKSDISLQAWRFRRHLPIVILTLVGTGSYQTVRLLGVSASGLFESLAGHLVILKVIVLTGLTGLVLTALRRAQNSDDTTG